MAANKAERYLLPCSASFKCFDRFSILDDLGDFEDVDGQVPFWPVLTTLLRTPVETPAQLAELLDTIAVTLRDTPGPAGDYELLKSFLGSSHPEFFDRYWPSIVELALELPQHFPHGTLPILSKEASRSALELSSRQAASLVVHQFLCTLRAPFWREDFFDFSIWYASGQRHEEACRIYLNCLFTYLETFISTSQTLQEDRYVTYTLITAEPGYAALGSSLVSLSPIEITVVDSYQTSPEQLGLPSGAAVVSAHRYIGFGQGVPAVLVTPPLEANQVLVVRGAKAVMNIAGQRREIRALAQDDKEGRVDWRQRTMLFMDALELDVEDDETGLPDLEPDRIAREINKAAIAFSSGSYDVVWSPLWGCGAFGGDPFVKVALLWCAASTAKASLKISCDRGSEDLAFSLHRLVVTIQRQIATAQDLLGLLLSIPRKTARLKTLDQMMRGLELLDRS
ncbi:poly glycohydrolase-domain-containing protein [Nemania sp. NC0429]|nr:poly glycohydrolase-domain-containing protein [Nemania sp. NC0429]